jgi:inhibitor of KinA
MVRCLTARLRADAPPGITALVPAIESLTIHYDPLRTDFEALYLYLDRALATLQITPEQVAEPVVIPVCYGGEFGPDLDDVATLHATTGDALIAAHSAGLYTVAMIGFLPGFPYLEGLAPGLHTPRRATPRTAVPAGSVGIGGSSTGIYPCTSPGGWQIIGRTPRTLFSPQRQRPALLQAGDRVRFAAISETAFRAMVEQP